MRVGEVTKSLNPIVCQSYFYQKRLRPKNVIISSAIGTRKDFLGYKIYFLHFSKILLNTFRLHFAKTAFCVHGARKSVCGETEPDGCIHLSLFHSIPP